MKLPAKYDSLTWQRKREARETYVKLQNGQCFFCKEELSLPVPDRIKQKEINWKLFPEGFLKYPVHLQHNHETGLTEGAVHNYCNAVMWQYHKK